MALRCIFQFPTGEVSCSNFDLETGYCDGQGYRGSLKFLHPNSTIVQGGSNMTGTDLCVNKPHKSRSYLNHLVP